MSAAAKNQTIEIAVVGAGVAGLAAGCALAEAGYKVTLLERRPFAGGRASSYDHPSLHEDIDCQHVLLGCCTNLIDLLERTGASHKVRWYKTITFLEPGGRRSDVRPSCLPAPLHSTPSFLRAKMLGNADKLAIARGMAEMMRGMPGDDSESVAQWMERSGQTEKAIRHFWEPTLIVTLNDSFENCSFWYAAKVFRELFLKTVEGSLLGIPTVPLSKLYAGCVDSILERNGTLHERTKVDGIEQERDGRWRLRAGEQQWTADAVVLAPSIDQMQNLLKLLPAEKEEGRETVAESLAHYTTSPYITTHLWFEREFTDLPHAAMLGSTYQWLFHKSRIRGWNVERGSYIELVIGGDRKLLPAKPDELVQLALDELRQFFPESRKVMLVKSGVLKEARATFSVTPGLDRHRPSQQSPWPGVFLAGDWTATGWPATMEGAARSGYLAAEALSASLGRPLQVLKPELEPAGLMKVLHL